MARNFMLHVCAYTLVLGVGIVGTAQALPGSGSVQRDDIRRNAVTSPKVAKNTLTGADIRERSLGTVPNAAHVNGMRLQTLSWISAPPPPAGMLPWLTLFAQDGLRVNATCFDSEGVHGSTVKLHSTVDGATVAATAVHGSNFATSTDRQVDYNFENGDSIFLPPGTGTAIFRTAGDRMVKLDYDHDGHCRMTAVITSG